MATDPPPDLALLSPEEALLISDILSRLNIGAPAEGPANVPQNSAQRYGTQAPRDPQLDALVAAEKAIERELQGMQGYGAPSVPSVASTWAVPTHHTRPTAPDSLAPDGLPVRTPALPMEQQFGSRYLANGVGMRSTDGTVPQSHVLYPPQQAQYQPPQQLSSNQYAIQPQQPMGPAFGSVMPAQPTLAGGGLASWSGGEPVQAQGLHTQATSVAGQATPAMEDRETHAQSNATLATGTGHSVPSLQQMREQLRQQQHAQQQQMQQQHQAHLQQQQQEVQQQSSQQSLQLTAQAHHDRVHEGQTSSQAQATQAPAFSGASSAGGQTGSGSWDAGAAAGGAPTLNSTNPPSGTPIPTAPASSQPNSTARTGPQARQRNQAPSAAPNRSTASAVAPGRAFTMLNARTSTERYGPEPSAIMAGEPSPIKAAKAPVRLPEQERSARLAQMYERSQQWRRKAEERAAKARHEKEAAALVGCTFSPKVAPGSQLMMQGMPPSVVYNEMSKWGTPTRHQQQPTARGSVSVPPGTKSHAPASVYATPTKTGAPTAAWTQPTSSAAPPPPTPAQPPAHARSPAPSSVSNGGGLPQRQSVGGAGSSTAAGSPPPVVVNGPQVGARLYSRAQELKERQRERVLRTLIEEERQRHFVAAVQDVQPRLYQQRSPGAAQSYHLPSGMDECTFHPRTRYRVMSSRTGISGDLELDRRFDKEPSSGSGGHRGGSRDSQGQLQEEELPLHDTAASGAGGRAPARARTPGRPRSSVGAPARSTSGRPKSAPHLRAEGARGRGVGAGGALAAGKGLHGGSSGGGAASQRTAASRSSFAIRPELDWEEFIERQEMFLAERERKLAVMEQGGPVVQPHMSPGSKKLLRERDMRKSWAREEGLAGAGLAGNGGLNPEPSSALTAGGSTVSPGRRAERRVRTVMEMYRECTFQPQITRRAAALPPRNVDDLADGGRARREEWAEQQRALAAVRELEGVTFKPAKQSTDAYDHVRSRISLKNPDAYLAHVAHKQRQREQLAAELAMEREALELQQCTFKPQTTPLPAYLVRRIQEEQAQRLAEEQQQEQLWWEEQQGLDVQQDEVDGPYTYGSEGGEGVAQQQQQQQQQQGYGEGYYGQVYGGGGLGGGAAGATASTTGRYQVNQPPEATAALHSDTGVGGGQGVARTEDFEQAYQRALKYALSAAAQDAQR